MKVNEVIKEAWFDMVKQATSVAKQARSAASAPGTYNRNIDRFQRELEVDSPADAAELKNLRQNYKLNPSYTNAVAIAKFISNKSKYTQNKESAQMAIKDAISAVQTLAPTAQPTAEVPPASPTSATPTPAPTKAPAPVQSTNKRAINAINVNGENIIKSSDGNWYDEEGAKIVNANDIKELERRLAAKSQPASAGAYVPNQPATAPKASSPQPPRQKNLRSKKRRRK